MTTRRISTLAVLVATALTLSFCKKEHSLAIVSDSNEVPVLNGNEDYPVSTNDHLATLGKVLFYDKELSLNKNIACGSCHQQQHAFTDNLQFSPGTNNQHTTRNTPSIFAKNGRLFWDGRSNSLPDLALRPVQNDVEMNIDNVDHLVQRIASLDYYSFLFQNAFPRALKVDSNMIKTAIAEFLRNFDFSNNKFHRSEKGLESLNQSEQLGKNLFFGEAKCSQCHHITPQSNTGGYGVTNEHHNIGLDSIVLDKGVGAVTRNSFDDGAFMMPVLLNIEYTAPYMHDGRFQTLEEVIEHYNSGIKDTPNLDRILRNFSPNSPPVRLNLSEVEKQALVDFLKTLSDPSILQDSRFSNPFVLRTR